MEFYNWVTPDIKAEFVDGEIIIHSPVRKAHSDCGLFLVKLLSTYVDIHDLGWVGYEKVMTRFTRNDYEPDVCYFSRDKSTLFEKDQTIFPVPDFVVEILSNATKERDRGIKLLDYQAHSVKEYWIIDAELGLVEQYIYDEEEKEYKIPMTYDKKATIESYMIPKFKIPIKALFDKATNIKTLTMFME